MPSHTMQTAAKKIITITLADLDLAAGTVSVSTSAAPPQVGRALTQAESLALDLLTICTARAGRVAFDLTRQSAPEAA